MFHPVGGQPPSVYWRRRLFVFAAFLVLLVLLIMTIKIATSGGADPAQAGASSSLPASTPAATPTTPHSSTAPKSSASRSSATPSHSAAPPPKCVVKDLAIAAVVAKPSYHVGDQPVVELQVANDGTKPCVQDLADKQVELRVYNGESRVWGSHDCKIMPGTAPRTLTPKTPVRVAITWSGLSSQPGCAGTRQRVGAGTYTLYALLAGRTGTATQFTIG